MMNGSKPIALSLLLSALTTFFIFEGASLHAQLSPVAERESFQFADPQLTAELVAAEPDVISPVALGWDAEGRLFVAEMRDYPNAAGGGTVRLLEDRDRDGRYERATVFADQLSFPNSVLAWNGGVLVTAAPDLLFLKDTDGDGRADTRQVLFTGFGTGNQQLRANGLLWGLDGWVYGANGRSDGSVHRPGETNSYSLRGRDFRFRPDTGAFETLAGRSQFGLARDDWGNRFLSWNTIPIRHEVFPDHYLARNPGLPAADSVADLLPAGDIGQVFPLTPPPLVFNNESSSHFNALAGLVIYRGAALGESYRGNAFVGETLRNLVHRRVLTPSGATFVASRAEVGMEFLRSSDPWFHPVNFATGPEGAFYVVDFYRQFVEHPDFVPREMRGQVGWRAGSERGRIWRIVRKTTRPQRARPGSGLAGSSVRELGRALESPNAWRRDTAQRLLVERNAREAAEVLRKLARHASLPEARAQALHTLGCLSVLDDDTLTHALRDAHPRVREQGVVLAGLRLGGPAADAARAAWMPLASSLASLINDADTRVRLQLALALGSCNDDALREAALSTLISSSSDRWLRLAAMSSSRSLSKETMASLLPQPSKSLRQPPAPASANPDRQRVMENFAPALKLTGDRGRGAASFARLCLACHYLQGHGQRVGPDLSGISSRPAEALLIDLLDPSRQVAPDYVTYEAVTTDGEASIGLLASETETRVTLRHAGAPDQTIARNRLQSLKPTGKSLMPDGLENGLSHQDVADLLEFLRHPDGALLR